MAIAALINMAMRQRNLAPPSGWDSARQRPDYTRARRKRLLYFWVSLPFPGPSDANVVIWREHVAWNGREGTSDEFTMEPA